MWPRHSFLWLLGLVLPTLAGASRIAVRRNEPQLTNPMEGFVLKRAEPASAPTPDRTSFRFSRLKTLKKQSTVREHSVMKAIRRSKPINSTKTATWYQNITGFGEFISQHAIQCAWDGQLSWFLVETGSSDTWAAKSDFQCFDRAGNRHQQSHCNFGYPRIDDFGYNEIEGMHFHAAYGSGVEVSGPMGFSDISCGGLMVSKQQVGLANKAFWIGNGVTVGMLGLAYPSLTSAYYGSLGEERLGNAIPYTPFLTNAFSQGKIDPLFSVAMLQNSSDGIIAWGGLPPIPWQREPVARADLIVANLIDQADTTWKYSFYTIIPDGVKWGQTTDTTKYPYIVDTGTSVLLLPPPLAEALARSFEPQAVYLYQWGTYFAPCDAVPPRFAIIISEVEFWINPAELINHKVIDPMTGYCAVAISSGEDGPFVLGGLFVQTALTVFDLGAAEMRFYPRE